MQISREKQSLAEQHYKHTLLRLVVLCGMFGCVRHPADGTPPVLMHCDWFIINRKCLVTWHHVVSAEVQSKNKMADEMYSYILISRSFYNWRRVSQGLFTLRLVALCVPIGQSSQDDCDLPISVEQCSTHFQHQSACLWGRCAHSPPRVINERPLAIFCSSVRQRSFSCDVRFFSPRDFKSMELKLLSYAFSRFLSDVTRNSTFSWI